MSGSPARQHVQSSHRNLITRGISACSKGRAMLNANTVSMHGQTVLWAIQHTFRDLHNTIESLSRAVSTAAPASRNRTLGCMSRTPDLRESLSVGVREPLAVKSATEMKCLKPVLDGALAVRPGCTLGSPCILQPLEKPMRIAMARPTAFRVSKSDLEVP